MIFLQIPTNSTMSDSARPENNNNYNNTCLFLLYNIIDDYICSSLLSILVCQFLINPSSINGERSQSNYPTRRQKK